MTAAVAVEAGVLVAILLAILWSAAFLGRAVQAALSIGVIQSAALAVINGSGEDPGSFATSFAFLTPLLGGIALVTWAPVVTLGAFRPAAARGRAITLALAAVVWLDFLLTSLVRPVWRSFNACIFPGGMMPGPLDGGVGLVCDLAGYPAIVGVVALAASYVIAIAAFFWPRS